MKYFIWVLFLLLVFGSCDDNGKYFDDSFSDCGTEASPYYLSENMSDTDYYRLDVWWWEPNAVLTADYKAIEKSVKYLNEKFAVAKMQFELNDVKVIVDSIKYFNQKLYRNHAREVDDWYWDNRYSEPHALRILVYPPDRRLFPGAAVDIPSTTFCIQQNFLNSSTVVHEAAHAFGGLYHTHQPDHTKGNSYKTGDLICDLRYHPPLIAKEYINISPDCSEIINPFDSLTLEEERRIVHNWMTYTLFKCRNSFTEDQIARMKFIRQNSEDIKRAKIN